jgi:hypothetical protein
MRYWAWQRLIGDLMGKEGIHSRTGFPMRKQAEIGFCVLVTGRFPQ